MNLNFLSEEQKQLISYSVLDSLFCGVLVIDMQGNIMFFNKSGQEIFKLCNDVIKGDNIENSELLKNLSMQVDIKNGSGRYIVCINNKSIICNVAPLSSDNKRIGSIFVLHESMNAKCLEQELDVTSSLLHEINIFIESAHDGFLITDNKGKIMKLNAAFERSYKVDRKDILGRNLEELIEEKVFTKSAAMQVIKSRKTFTIVTIRDNQKIVATATPVFDSKGNFTSVVVNTRDMTELDKLQNQLDRQQAIAAKYFRDLQEINERNFERDGVIGNSKAMRKINSIINAISETDSTVLITGDSGVGKEIIVNKIYRTSCRNGKPFIKINCGAIPGTLFESEMFGYESGAFTGAKSKGKPGFFEVADGGTLFLDEIGELSPIGQVKLLRAIQEKEIMRVGGTQTIKTDVRIIAATNRNLLNNIDKGTFREDLYYRLSVISIEVPPLRKRRDDIVPLALFFLNKFNKKYNKKKEISMKLAKFLRRLDWPGNIRELENLIENLVVLINEDILYPQHIPERYYTDDIEYKISVHGIISMKEAIEATEKQLIKNAFQKYTTTTEIAKKLQVNQSTISRKIKKYKIN